MHLLDFLKTTGVTQSPTANDTPRSVPAALPGKAVPQLDIAFALGGSAYETDSLRAGRSDWAHRPPIKWFDARPGDWESGWRPTAPRYRDAAV